MAASLTERIIEGADGRREIVLEAQSTHDAVEAVIDRIGHLIRDLPLSECSRYRIQFVAHEALSNAVVHGNHSDPAKPVTATCRVEPAQLTLVIDDQGNGFAPSDVPDPTTDCNVLRESGRGVFLMRAYADECRFERGGRRVVLVKRFDLPHGTAPDAS